MSKRTWRVAGIAAVSVAALATPASAEHSWNTYHWNRTSAQITPPVVYALTGDWLPRVQKAVSEWNGNDPDRGQYTDYIESPGPNPASGVNPKTCKAQAGKILVCNARYGFNGWLGIASIWLSGGHISQGTTKLNDSYFNTATYNKEEWKQLVTCQEIGHDYGLGHQDEDFNTDNTQSCMDYTNKPLGNETPDAHDYEQLEIIYGHQHSNFTAVSPGKSGAAVGRAAPAPFADGGIPGDGPSEWGRAIHHDAQGRPDTFELDLGGGNKKITHVFWTLEARRGDDH